MPFPSTITAFPTVNPTDRLNNPSHSALENLQSSTIGQLQTFIGTNASAVGTLIYDVRSPNSNGGGHIQSANKGGTGQTTYNKGDLLVATSSSVISKVVVGGDGQVLVADSTQAAGVKWSTPNATKIAVNTTSVFAVEGQTSTAVVLYSASIVGSTLGTNNAIKFTGELRRLAIPNSNFNLVVNYGNNVIASVLILSTSSLISATGVINGVIAASGVSNQFGFVNINAAAQVAIEAQPKAVLTGSGRSSVNSSANQDLIITGQMAVGVGSVVAGIFVVEKIV